MVRNSSKQTISLKSSIGLQHLFNLTIKKLEIKRIKLSCHNFPPSELVPSTEVLLYQIATVPRNLTLLAFRNANNFRYGVSSSVLRFDLKHLNTRSRY